MRLLLLGSPGTPGDPVERWHDDAYHGALQLDWDVTFMRAKTASVADIVRAARGADMLLWMRTHDYNIKGGDGHQMLRRVEDLGVATVGVHFDLYWGISHRQGRIGREPWWSAQHVFTADGGSHHWEGRSVNHHWCPPPFGTRYLGYGQADAAQTASAVFVGSYIPSIHSQHRASLIRWAGKTWGRYFRHVGRTAPERVYGRALNDLYASSKLVLGESVMSPYYWSDRLPRTLGRGGLLAYPHTQGLDEWGFTDEVMIRYRPGNFQEITQKFNALSPADRRTMTDSAITLVREKHLWRHRLAHIAEVALHGARDYRGGRPAGKVEELPRRAQPLGAR